MQEGNCQSNSLAPEDSALIVHLTDELAFYKGEVKKLLLLKEDTALLNAALKEMSLAVDQYTKGRAEDKDHVSILQSEYDRQKREIAKMQEISSMQENLLNKYKAAKDKRWSFGPVGSYGLSGAATMGLNIGFGVVYRLFSL